jgi:integrase
MGPRITPIRAGQRPADLSLVAGGDLPDTPASGHGPLDLRLEAYNSTLGQLGIRLRLERRGGRLGLRGPLPLRQGQGSRIQRLSLGLPATESGLETALGRLRLVAAQLEVGGFQWSDWAAERPGRQPPGPGEPGGPAVEALPPPTQTFSGRGGHETSNAPDSQRPASSALPGVAHAAATSGFKPGLPPSRWGPFGPGPASRLAGLIAACESFEQAFVQAPRRRHRAGSRSTWTAAYRPYLRRLLALADDDGEAQLSGELLLRTLESYQPGSSGRQRCASALAALAEQQGITLPSDWRERSGGYGLHAARFRQLPSDEQILKLVQEIPNLGWRLAYGLMATYGLRNHEVFFSDLSSLAPGGDRVLRVLPNSKTGEHQVWPFQPEWVEWFDLERLGRDTSALPPVARDLRHTTLRHAGRRVAEQFRRYGLPITPYDLRHAWAVRTIHIGLPDTVAARMMGHSVAVHTRTYHHWITRRDQQRAVDAALARRLGG